VKTGSCRPKEAGPPEEISGSGRLASLLGPAGSGLGAGPSRPALSGKLPQARDLPPQRLVPGGVVGEYLVHHQGVIEVPLFFEDLGHGLGKVDVVTGAALIHKNLLEAGPVPGGPTAPRRSIKTFKLLKYNPQVKENLSRGRAAPVAPGRAIPRRPGRLYRPETSRAPRPTPLLRRHCRRRRRGARNVSSRRRPSCPSSWIR